MHDSGAHVRQTDVKAIKPDEKGNELPKSLEIKIAYHEYHVEDVEDVLEEDDVATFRLVFSVLRHVCRHHHHRPSATILRCSFGFLRTSHSGKRQMRFLLSGMLREFLRTTRTTEKTPLHRQDKHLLNLNFVCLTNFFKALKVKMSQVLKRRNIMRVFLPQMSHADRRKKKRKKFHNGRGSICLCG